jgi:hypothetical protein
MNIGKAQLLYVMAITRLRSDHRNRMAVGDAQAGTLKLAPRAWSGSCSGPLQTESAKKPPPSAGTGVHNAAPF